MTWSLLLDLDVSHKSESKLRNHNLGKANFNQKFNSYLIYSNQWINLQNQI